jgi:hypothetical protein
MGSEKVLKQIKKSNIGTLILGIVLAVIGALMEMVFIPDGFADNAMPIIIFLIILGVGIALIVLSVRVLADPKKSSVMKNNPDILKQADELFGNITYQDKFLILSPRIIANAKKLTEMAYTDEVFLIYVYTHKTNGVTDQKQLKLLTARGEMGLNIYGKKDDEVDNLANRVLANCRYAKAGYTQEGLAYVNQMRELWKRDQMQKKTVINGEIQQ